MTLLGAILNKAKSQESVAKKYTSPPPEIDETARARRRKVIDKYSHVRAVEDSKPPLYNCGLLTRNLPKWRRHVCEMAADNTRLVMAIKMAHFNRGKVDCHWSKRPPSSRIYYDKRVHFLRQLQRDNRAVYARLVAVIPRVETTASLQRNWLRNRNEILQRAQNKFVLFPPVSQDTMEDTTFLKSPGVNRQRVYITIRLRGGAVIGELKVELFQDVCPATCRLFLELLDGDESGYGYVGTCFFRKVPGLFWSGGDVVYDNGFGCYAQRGRRVPIGAENFHFPHSMPGLLSMRVTRDNEVCGNFNITFKPLPQFDLWNVVFGRIIRPCSVYESIRGLGDALSSRPVVEISSARRCINTKWRNGAKNAYLPVLNRKIQ